MAEAWVLLTSILFYRDWDIPAAEQACRRAIELDPRNVISRQRYIDLLRVQGRTSEAKAHIDQAIQLHPAAAGLRLRRAVLLYQLGDCENAIREAAAAASLTNTMPTYPMTQWVHGLCLEQQKRYPEAEKRFRAALSFQPHDPWNEPALGHLLALTGRSAEAEAILSELKTQRERGRMTHISMAIIQTALGRRAEALASIERGYADRDDSTLFIALEPRLEPLSKEHRFPAVVERVRSHSKLSESL